MFFFRHAREHNVTVFLKSQVRMVQTARFWLVYSWICGTSLEGHPNERAAQDTWEKKVGKSPREGSDFVSCRPAMCSTLAAHSRLLGSIARMHMSCHRTLLPWSIYERRCAFMTSHPSCLVYIGGDTYPCYRTPCTWSLAFEPLIFFLRKLACTACAKSVHFLASFLPSPLNQAP